MPRSRSRGTKEPDLALLVFSGNPDCMQAAVNQRLRMYPGSTVYYDVTEVSLMEGLIRSVHDTSTLAYFLSCSEMTDRMRRVIELNSNRIIEWYDC